MAGLDFDVPCFHPIKAWRGINLSRNGKRCITFKRSEAYTDITMELPCGQCHGCRLERSRQWAVRCLHEASMHDNNTFITLTYKDIPLDGSLDKKHFQDFMKRLRVSIPHKIRYYHCGEYGDEFNRPHYHAIIFNHEFSDQTLWKDDGHRLYTSKTLDKLWTHGRTIVGAVTFESAAYVARYIMKKINVSDKSPDHLKTHYLRGPVDLETGEQTSVLPEYTTMSRRPGIGHGWFQKYADETFPDDFIIINGHKATPPKYYMTLLESYDKLMARSVRDIRLAEIEKHADNNTPDRLYVREIVSKAKLSHNTRTLE